MGDSSNRCINVNCTKTLDCQSNVKCWNASSCGGPFCNNTDVYRYFDEAKQDVVSIPAEGLCGGFDCINDDICYYGCANATSCLFYYEVCNNSYQIKVWNETTKARDIVSAQERCENTPCMVDEQCAFKNDCFNGTCTSSRNFCNRTATYQTFDDDSGKWTRYISENRCLGTQCHADEQCAFDHTKKLVCSNATCQALSCNGSYIYAFYNDSSETILDYAVAEDRCAGIPCGSDDKCFSGKCFNASCLSSFQTKPFCAPAPQTLKFDEVAKTTTVHPATSRCDEVYCQYNSSCSSNQCYTGKCFPQQQ